MIMSCMLYFLRLESKHLVKGFLAETGRDTSAVPTEMLADIQQFKTLMANGTPLYLPAVATHYQWGFKGDSVTTPKDE